MSRVVDANGNLMHDVTQAVASHSVREWNNDLDRNAFLNLLMTQLRYQDPLNPMDDREFIAQMAQFSSLEQMQQLNTTFNRTHAFSMIGNHVVGITRDIATGAASEVYGIVDTVRMIAGEPWLVMGAGTINERMMRASEVQLVEGNLSEEMLRRIMESVNDSLTFNMVNQNLALVGRYVQAVMTDAQGNPTRFIEGRVEYIDFSGNPPLLIIGNDAVHLGQVLSVANSRMIIGHDIGVSDGSGNVTTHEIIGVHISAEGNAYLRLVGAGNQRIDRINFVSEALRLQRAGLNPPDGTNLQVTHGGRTGTVTNVVVYDGRVWFNIDNGTDVGEPIRFADFASAN